MKLGVLVDLDYKNIDKKIKQVKDFGFEFCQLCCWKKEFFTNEMADMIIQSCEKYDVQISTFWCGWSGAAIWNFYDGPLTLGLVPLDYRYNRMKELMQGSDFAKKLGIKNFATHVGFLPETPNTEQYRSLLCALRSIVSYCKENGQYFLFETGQETPVTLLRTIEDIGADNIGINLDPANLILYGKANPIDALDILGSYVRDIHAKDGCYPQDGKNLGIETPIGEGKVDFPAFIKKLKEIGYDGTLTIEREISGDQQSKDIISAKSLLEVLI